MYAKKNKKNAHHAFFLNSQFLNWIKESLQESFFKLISQILIL